MANAANTENDVMEDAFREALQAGASNKNNNEDEDIDSILDDALNDFQAPKRDQGQAPRPSPRFDPLHRGNPPPKSKLLAPPKELIGKEDKSAAEASSSTQKKASSSKSTAFNPLPSRSAKKGAGKKSDKQPPSSSSGAETVPSDFAAQLGSLMQELAVAEQDSQGASQDGKQQEKMSETLKALSQEARRLQSEGGAERPSSSNDIFNEPMFAGLQEQLLRGDEGGGGGVGGLADALMRQLLSKDVLQQPLAEIGEQYPKWLRDNRDRLSPAELRNYTNQYHHIKEILHIYENDADNYDRLFQELHQMQQCGQPPDDIVKEMAPGMSFGSDGLPKLPGDASTCSIQ